MPDAIEVRKVPIKHVSDASGLAELIDAGIVDADRLIAVIGKTEGNGGVNDYTRIIADRAFREVLVAKGSRTAEQAMQVPIVWSGGPDGVISPTAPPRSGAPSPSARSRCHLGGNSQCRTGPARPPALDRPRRPAGQRLPQVRGVAGRRGPGTAQRHAR